jgi:purine-nucleoside phosphorylase
MISQSSVDSFRSKVHALGAKTPKVHVVLGSGFGEALGGLDSKTWKNLGEISFKDIEGLSPSTVPDHKGAYQIFRHSSGHDVCFQLGRLHGYEGHTPREVVRTVMIPRLCGVENFILTNAAGGLDLKMKSGDVVVISDHVNMTGMNPLYGPNPKGPSGKELGPRFPDMGNCYNPEFRAGLKKSFENLGIKPFEGTYMGLLGPTFETHAEVRLFASWGIKAVGMSTVWETISLHHSGAKVAAVSMVANLGAGLVDEKIEHEVIVENCRKSAAKIISGVSGFLETLVRK